MPVSPSFSSLWRVTPLALLAAMAALPAHAVSGLTPSLFAPQPDTGNTSAASNWRFTAGQLFNGVAALDGVARITFAASDGNYICSGSLLAGGAYVLTAGHCADDYTSMTVQFGYQAGAAAVTRTVAVGAATLHPLWQGFDNSVDRGIDVAILKLNAPVTTIQGYALSTTNDVGKQHLMAGYGTTQRGSTNSPTSFADGSYGHYGYNTFDVTSQVFNQAVDQVVPGWGYDAAYYAPGTTYMVDFDNVNGAAANNTLGRVADATGNKWSSSTGLGANEALIAGGDSGGGDFVWDGTRWLLSGVHSWGWDGGSVCSDIPVAGGNTCDAALNNDSSYGDLSGSTAVFAQAAWINSVIAVPEPATYGLLALGLGVIGLGVRHKRSS